MPYIPQEDRDEIINGTGTIDIAYTRRDLGLAVGQACRNGGDFQYILAVAIQTYLEEKGLRYQNCQDIMGALTGANAEFYRKVVAKYEDLKMLDNGPVYDVDGLMTKDY